MNLSFQAKAPIFRKCVLLAMFLSLSLPAYGGMIWGVSSQWQNLSFQPEEQEDTPNFYGLGLRGDFGYSVAKSVEARLFASYNYSNKGAAKFFEGDVNIGSYGASIGVRLVDSVYLGVEYGVLYYHTPSHHIHNEYVGRWDGTTLNLNLAGYWKAGRKSYWQVGLQLGGGSLLEEDSVDDEERKVDTIALNVTYLFISPK